MACLGGGFRILSTSIASQGRSKARSEHEPSKQGNQHRTRPLNTTRPLDYTIHIPPHLGPRYLLTLIEVNSLVDSTQSQLVNSLGFGSQ